MTPKPQYLEKLDSELKAGVYDPWPVYVGIVRRRNKQRFHQAVSGGITGGIAGAVAVGSVLSLAPWLAALAGGSILALTIVLSLDRRIAAAQAIEDGDIGDYLSDDELKELDNLRLDMKPTTAAARQSLQRINQICEAHLEVEEAVAQEQTIDVPGRSVPEGEVEATPAIGPVAMAGGGGAQPSTALAEILASPFTSRAFFGAQRTGKSMLVAVAGKRLSQGGIKIFHINLSSSSRRQEEDDLYTRHVTASVRGDISRLDEASAIDLVDAAIALVEVWWETAQSILVIDEWAVAAHKVMPVTNRFIQLVAAKIVSLASSGMKNTQCVWLLAPRMVAEDMDNAGKTIKSLSLCYASIAPGKTVDWEGQAVRFDEQLFSQVGKNFDSLIHPRQYSESLPDSDRIAFINGQWLALGVEPNVLLESEPVDSPVVEQVRKQMRAQQGGLYGSERPENTEASASLFDDFLNEDIFDDPALATDKIDAEINNLKMKRSDRAQCLGELLEFIRKKAIEEGVVELKRGEITTSSWATKWKRKGTVFANCSGADFERFIIAVIKAGFLVNEDGKAYRIQVS